jgi:hypothetical protein
MLKKPNTKNRAGRLAQGVGPEFKPWYRKKKKKSFLWYNKMTSHLAMDIHFSFSGVGG